MLKNLSQAHLPKIKRISIYFNFILLISFLKLFNCQDSCFPSIISNTNCFNNILIFNDKNYKAENFSTNKNGDILIEFSEDNEISSSR